MAITRGTKFIAFLALALSFALFVAEGHRGLATPPVCTCQNNNNNNNNHVTKNNNNNNDNTSTSIAASNNSSNTTKATTSNSSSKSNTSKTTTTTTKNGSTSSNNTAKNNRSSNSTKSTTTNNSNNTNNTAKTTTNNNSSSSSNNSSSSSSNSKNNNTHNNNTNTTTTTTNNSSSSSSSNNNNNNNDNNIYDVTTFGAQGNGNAVYKNGESMNGIAFMQAWQKACNMSIGPSKVVIPKGIFAVAQIIFAGPCKTNNVTIEVQGNLVADLDVSQFPNHEFIVFQNVDGVTFTGQGTLDVSNQVNKSCNPTKNDADIFNQMPSIKLFKATNVVVEGITSVNPASQHLLVLESQKVTIRNVKFNEESVAPKMTKSSNGIYISASTQISVSNSYISTTEDCVTVAPGSTSISITGLTCATGKGICIGSLPFLKNVLDVKGVLVKNSVFKGTSFGVKIDPRLQAKLSLISDINVEDSFMDGVQIPIVIHQQENGLLTLAESIQAKISNVNIKNINGTVTTKNALSFSCSPISPCEGIKVDDVDLRLQVTNDLSIIGKTLDGVIGRLDSLVNCLNAKVVFGGNNQGLSCGILP